MSAHYALDLNWPISPESNFYKSFLLACKPDVPV